MTLTGHVQNGVVVLPGGTDLPNGMAVTVSTIDPDIVIHPGPRVRVQLPLLRSDNPGSLNLTNQMIADLLEADDVLAGQ